MISPDTRMKKFRKGSFDIFLYGFRYDGGSDDQPIGYDTEVGWAVLGSGSLEAVLEPKVWRFGEVIVASIRLLNHFFARFKTGPADYIVVEAKVFDNPIDDFWASLTGRSDFINITFLIAISLVGEDEDGDEHRVIRCRVNCVTNQPLSYKAGLFDSRQQPSRSSSTRRENSRISRVNLSKSVY